MLLLLLNLIFVSLFEIGKWNRFYGKRQLISYKRRDFKKAYVQLDKPKI